MKKVMLIISLIALLTFTSTINASCNSEELNEWATKVEAKFTLSSEINNGKFGYAYFLSIEPYRSDVKIRVIDGKGKKANGKTFDYFENEKKYTFYAVGCYNNLNEETYTIEVYGNDKGKCKDQLLKKLTYTVPRFNRQVNTKYCAKFPEHELCQIYTNATKDMSINEFNDIMSSYEKANKKTDNSLINGIISLLKYLIYILIPFGIITIIYVRKIQKYNKEEREK